MPETILVTGGAGFVGRWVCEALLRRGHDVREIDALADMRDAREHLGFETQWISRQD